LLHIVRKIKGACNRKNEAEAGNLTPLCSRAYRPERTPFLR
jgi:hypothetical protein